MSTGDRGPATRPLRFLVADDDQDDWEFISNALLLIGASTVSFVRDGQELLEYLRRQGVYARRTERESPDVVILDLKMPKMGGAETLSEIRADPSLKRVPVVVLTTSTSEDDVNDTYERGANSVISKPSSFTGLVEVLRGVRSYWAEVAHLPTSTPRARSTFIEREVVLVNGFPAPPSPKRRFSWRKRPAD